LKDKGFGRNRSLVFLEKPEFLRRCLAKVQPPALPEFSGFGARQNLFGK
jgi:hypothetical protein